MCVEFRLRSDIQKDSDMTNKTPLDMDDLDARSHDLDDAKADEVSGGFMSIHKKTKMAAGKVNQTTMGVAKGVPLPPKPTADRSHKPTAPAGGGPGFGPSKPKRTKTKSFK